MTEYILSDPHFGHQKILEYTNRPYSTVEEMDEALIENWNETVDDDDVVYLLGDIRHHPGRCARHYIEQLDGTIVLIRGNHDPLESVADIPSLAVLDSATLQRGKYHFYLEHKPVEFDGWSINGHCHDNDLVVHPFIHPGRKTVNVSVELIDFTPLSMDRLVRLVSETYKPRRKLC